LIVNFIKKYIENLSPNTQDQRIVLIGQRITDEILQTSSFLRKKWLRITCLEFSFFQAGGGRKLLSHDIVVGKRTEKAQTDFFGFIASCFQ